VRSGSVTPHQLHQRIEEHKASVIGKHMKEVHGVAFTDLAEMFSVLKKCRGKLDCLIQEMLTRSQTQYVQKYLLLPHALSRQTPMTTKHLLF